MGAGQSTQASESVTPPHALHVLRVTPDSPASKTTIEPLFDFVVGIEGDSLDSQIDAAALERIVEGHEGRTLNLLVWNNKSRNIRVVPIVPSRAWALPSAKSSLDLTSIKPSLLGLSMRMCEPELAMDNVWHVLDVLEGSPAESAGLVPYGDYITGWSGGVLSAENDFYDLVEAHVDKPLRVYVYSHDFDALREVVLVPNRHWGGEGLLGCVFGYGLLHRIPPQTAERVPGTPPELQETADDYEEQELFVPADIQPDVPQLANLRRQQDEQWRSEQPQTYPPTLVPTIEEEEESITPSITPPNEHDHDGHDHEHDHHGHEHDHDHHGHDHHGHDHSVHATPTNSPPGPPRRTSSLNSTSSFRSSRVPSASATSVFSSPGRVSSPSILNAVSGNSESSDTDPDDDGSLTSVD